MSEHLILDDFDVIMNEIDENQGFHRNGGRIVHHILQELIDDFIPNSAFNSITNR